MTKIEEQIKELTLKKKTIEFLQHILRSVEDYNENDFSEVQEEVVKIMRDFVSSKIEEIETGKKSESTKLAEDIAGFTQDEVQALKQVVGKLKQKNIKQPPDPGKKEENSPQKRESTPSIQDAMSFAMQNRHLSGKKVTAQNDQGGTIEGQVVGTDFPNLLVKTENGVVVKVPRERLSVLN